MFNKYPNKFYIYIILLPVYNFFFLPTQLVIIKRYTINIRIIIKRVNDVSQML